MWCRIRINEQPMQAQLCARAFMSGRSRSREGCRTGSRITIRDVDWTGRICTQLCGKWNYRAWFVYVFIDTRSPDPVSGWEEPCTVCKHAVTWSTCVVIRYGRRMWQGRVQVANSRFNLK